MKFEEVLLRETGSSDIGDAASLLAARVRARARGHDNPRLIPREPETSNLTYQRLVEIGKSCGIVSYIFGAPISSEAELRPLAAGGLQVRTIHASPKGRALFAVAHEIGHTFFYDLGQRPPCRIIHEPTSSQGSIDHRHYRQEEEFCDKFAWRLLFPDDSDKHALAECARAQTPKDLVVALDRVRRSGISIGLSLLKLNEFGWFPNDLMAVVLRWQPHSKSRRDPALRVAASYPSPSTGWFVPKDQRAVSIGFNGAIRLNEWWHAFPNRNPGVAYRRSGKLGFGSANGKIVIAENDSIEDLSYPENLNLWTKQSAAARWTRCVACAPVTYRFYGISATEAYCLCIIDLSDVDMTQTVL